MTEGKNPKLFKVLGIKGLDTNSTREKTDAGYQPTPMGSEKGKVPDLAVHPPKGGSAIKKPETQPKEPTK